MARGLVLLLAAALAQNNRPWNRLGEQIGLRKGPVSHAVPVPAQEGPVPMATVVSQEGPVPLATAQAGPVPLMQAMSSSSVGRTDANGCVLGSGYQWCEAKSKCLRAWEEPCEGEQAPSTPECREGQVLCTELLQKQGQNCVLATCFQAASSPRPAVGGSRDLHGCVSGAGFTWCDGKQKCLRQWEEPCEEIAAPGGAQDEHGCTLGGGFQWCENKQKCLREWEEPCQEDTPVESLNLIRDMMSKRVSPEQRAQMETVMAKKKAKVQHALAEMKEKQTQFQGMMQQKLAEIEQKDIFSGQFGVVLNNRMRALADSFGKPVREVKAPAITDEVL